MAMQNLLKIRSTLRRISTWFYVSDMSLNHCSTWHLRNSRCTSVTGRSTNKPNLQKKLQVIPNSTCIRLTKRYINIQNCSLINTHTDIHMLYIDTNLTRTALTSECKWPLQAIYSFLHRNLKLNRRRYSPSVHHNYQRSKATW